MSFYLPSAQEALVTVVYLFKLNYIKTDSQTSTHHGEHLPSFHHQRLPQGFSTGIKGLWKQTHLGLCLHFYLCDFGEVTSLR